MPTTSPKLIPLPKPEAVLIDQKTGLPTKDFYDWLVRLQAVVTRLRLEMPGTPLTEAADDTAAAAAGIPVGGFYKTTIAGPPTQGIVKIRVT